MYKSLILSSGFHLFIIFFAMITLPFVAKKPLDIPPIVSIELIQITDETNIPYAPKAKKIIEKVKKEQEKLVSEQAPPKKIKKEKPDSIPLPDKKVEKIKKIEEKKQNPEKEGRFKIMLVPNITNICYGRGVGYKIEEIVLPEEIQKISATKIRAKMREEGKLK